MPISRHSGGLLIVLYLAVVGYLLVTLPPRVIAEYHATNQRNPDDRRGLSHAGDRRRGDSRGTLGVAAGPCHRQQSPQTTTPQSTTA